MVCDLEPGNIQHRGKRTHDQGNESWIFAITHPDQIRITARYHCNQAKNSKSHGTDHSTGSDQDQPAPLLCISQLRYQRKVQTTNGDRKHGSDPKYEQECPPTVRE